MKSQTVFLLGLIAGIALSAPAAGVVKNYKDIKYPPLQKFEIPKPEVYTLPNGLQVFLMEDSELPLISVTARIRTGSYYESAEKTGLAGMAGSVQRSGGTTRMTGDQIDDFLAARAASVETGIGGDSGSAGMDCLKQDFDDVFKVFVEVLRTPAFAQDKLDLVKISARTGISRRNDSVGQVASRELARLVYGKDSPLARLMEYATVDAITREDLVQWHQKFYHPNRILLGVAGDFKSAEMKKKLEVALGDWKRGPEFKLPPVPYQETPKPGIYYIEKTDVNQANITMGHLGIMMDNPDYFAAQVMNEVLGGGFASRMFSNVRSRQGLAYSVSASLGAGFTRPGLFSAGLQTKFSNTAKAIDAVKAEVSGIISKPTTDVELKQAKDSILNSFIFNYDSKDKILGQQMTYAYYGFPADFLDRYRANIEKVTIADVSRVAAKYVHPDQLAVLVVGKESEFDRPLSSMGKVTPVDITIPAPADTTPKVQKNAASEKLGKEIWAKVVKTLGGEEIKKAQGVQSAGSVAISMGGQSMSIKQSSTVVFPDKVRQVMTTPMGEQVIVMNGDEAFMQMGDRVQSLPAPAAQEQKKDQARNMMHLLHAHDDPGLEVVAAGEEEVAGAKCQVLSVSWKGADTRLWVDADGKVLKQSHQGNNPMTRTPGKLDILYTDYRAVGTAQVAYKQTRQFDGEEVMSVTLESFELNPKVDPALFQKPAQ